MPSLEMLKKLLDEFTEKEAHTREEINVITEQIGELEKRIMASQEKLGKVGADREKVRAMQARYSGGSTLTTGPLGAAPPGSSASSTPAEESKESRPRPGRAASQAAAPAAPGSSDTGIPPAPLNVRASSTRIPAIKAPDLFAEPAAAAPVSPASPFLAQSEPAAQIEPYAAAAADANQVAAAASAQTQASNSTAFSPMDIFGTPTDQIPEATPELPNNFAFTQQQPAAPSTPAASAAAAALDLFSTGVSQIDIGLASNYAQQPQQDVGAQTSDSPFYKPIGAEAVRPDPEVTQPFATIGDATVPPSQAAAAPISDQDAQEDLDDEPDDTVKSINDALRGLFR